MKHLADTRTTAAFENIIIYSEAYYQQFNISLQPEHFQLFMRHLPANLRGYYLKLGFEGSKRSSLFRRFVLEAHGHLLQDYLRDRLSNEEYIHWLQQDKYYKSLLKKVDPLPAAVL